MRVHISIFLFALSYAQLPFLLSKDKVAEALNNFVGDIITDIRAYKNMASEPIKFKCLLAPIAAILKDSQDMYGLLNTILYTGKQIPDIGDQDSCSLYDETKFVLVTNGTDEKGLIKPVFGICAPKECPKEDIKYIFNIFLRISLYLLRW